MAARRSPVRTPDSPPLAAVVHSYRRLSFAMALAGTGSAVAVAIAYHPSAIDVGVSLATGAPTWIISRRRMARQLGTAAVLPAFETEPASATWRRFFARVGVVTAALAGLLVAIPALLGASA